MDRLSAKQREVVEFYQGYNVPARWYIGEQRADGVVEVIALGEGFVWAIQIEHDGTENTCEATLGEWETGIEV